MWKGTALAVPLALVSRMALKGRGFSRADRTGFKNGFERARLQPRRLQNVYAALAAKGILECRKLQPGARAARLKLKAKS